jgi:predicted negative regulator of RcsB-dependent stress response
VRVIRGIFPFVLLAGIAAAQGPAPQEQGQLDASQSLFAVMSAINAAGYDADLQSPANSPVREMVRRELASRNITVLPELKRFFAAHRQNDWTAELSQYISFALSVDGPPNFAFRYRPEELPPDVVRLDGFQELLVQFNQEANLAELWRKAQPAFDDAIARYHRPAMNALLEVNAYLRNSGSGGALGTRFQIFVDLLGAPNQIQSRSYKSDYFIVVTPSAEPQADDIRHAYLHYLLDPLSLRYSSELVKKNLLLQYAQNAPYLEPYYKSDFSLLATECLIKAVESRLAPASRRQAIVDQALREGYILTPAFAEGLPAYEKQEQSLVFYYPELVASIDVAREQERLSKVQFASQAPVRRAREVPVPQKPEVTGARRTLEQAEQLYLNRDLDNARTAYLKVLTETSERPLHALAYYGLARIAALQKNPELSQQFFEKTLVSEPDPQTKAWAYVYLGRLADAAGDRKQAAEHYQAALGVDGASAAAREAAQKGLEQAFRRDNLQR